MVSCLSGRDASARARGGPSAVAGGGAVLRDVLRQMLDRPGADGRPDLRANVARIAALLDDLTRHRVLKLDSARFDEYVELTGRYAAGSDRPSVPAKPSAIGRLLSRGFLFAVLAAREQLRGPSSGLRIALRARLLRLLVHAHGLGPGVGDVDLRAGRLIAKSLDDPEVHGLVHNYLRAALSDLGSGRRPLVDEMVMTVALLGAALAFGAMRAGASGRTTLDAQAVTEGLLETMDLAHAEPEGAYARVLVSLAGGLDALRAFASA
jgi:hypothetical protein